MIRLVVLFHKKAQRNSILYEKRLLHFEDFFVLIDLLKPMCIKGSISYCCFHTL